MSGLAAARRVADAVLYEGYVLFPYRASAKKNQVRWQFGVVVPQAQADVGASEPALSQTECLLQAPPGTEIRVTVRCLQVQRREVQERTPAGEFRSVQSVEVDGQSYTNWDEGVEREVDTGPIRVDGLIAAECTVPFNLEDGREVEELAGAQYRLVRTREAASGVIGVSAEVLEAERDLYRLRIVVHNRTGWCDAAAPRDDVLRRSFVGLHAVASTTGGAFVSLLDPPEWAQVAARSCTNLHTYPVLIGEQGARDVVLSSPIILYDYPEVAPESAGDFYDATEIDELLSLMVSTLTDEEKREARATDPRAAAVIDRSDDLPAEVLDRLHGAVRYLDETTQPVTRQAALDQELSEFFGVGEDPPDRTLVDGEEVAVGDRVRLRPRRRADAQDLFVDGKLARVARIVGDVDGTTYLAVTLDDDPGADLHEWFGRFLYFHLDEIELCKQTTTEER